MAKQKIGGGEMAQEKGQGSQENTQLLQQLLDVAKQIQQDTSRLVELEEAEAAGPTPPDPEPPTGDWPNEPEGLTVITNLWPMNNPLPPQTNPPGDGPITGAQDWRIAHNWPKGHIWSEADPIESPWYGTPSGWTELDGDCYKLFYPKGMRLGTAPSTIYHSVPNYSRLYFACDWKVSEPFDYSTNGTKIAFMFHGAGGQVFLCMAPDGLVCFMPEVTPVDAQYRIRHPNVQPTVVIRNVWHKLEWLYEMSLNATVPSKTKWWLDGVLQGDWADIINDRPSPCVEMQFSPTFGGNGDTYVQTNPGNAYWFRNAHLSGAGPATRAGSGTGAAWPTR